MCDCIENQWKDEQLSPGFMTHKLHKRTETRGKRRETEGKMTDLEFPASSDI